MAEMIGAGINPPPAKFPPDCGRLWQLAPDACGMHLSSSTRYGLGGRQQRRMAEILRKAREQIARRPSAMVDICELAGQLGMSRQSIYNIAGDRTAVLNRAITEYHSAVVSSAAAMEGYPNIFMALADVFWCSALKAQDFNKSVTRGYFSGNRMIMEVVQSLIKNRFMLELKELDKKDYLKKSVSIDRVCDHMLAVVSSSTFVSLEDSNPDIFELRKTYASGIGLIVMGACAKGDQETENWLERVYRKH